jgi:hypothetical protein
LGFEILLHTWFIIINCGATVELQTGMKGIFLCGG